MKIKPIEKRDNSYLSTIIKKVFEEFDAPKTGTVYSDPTTNNLFELFDKTPNSVLWVAEENRKILGCCGVYPTNQLPNGYVELVKFYLTKEARNKGIGKMLFEKSITSARKFDYSHLYIESQPSFSKALKIYEKFGFEYLSNSLGDSGHSNCNIWMLKEL